MRNVFRFFSLGCAVLLIFAYFIRWQDVTLTYQGVKTVHRQDQWTGQQWVVNYYSDGIQEQAITDNNELIELTSKILKRDQVLYKELRAGEDIYQAILDGETELSELNQEKKGYLDKYLYQTGNVLPAMSKAEIKKVKKYPWDSVPGIDQVVDRFNQPKKLATNAAKVVLTQKAKEKRDRYTEIWWISLGLCVLVFGLSFYKQSTKEGVLEPPLPL